MENTDQVSHLPKFLCIFLFPLINVFPFPSFSPLTPSPLHVSCLLNSSVLYLSSNCLQCPSSWYLYSGANKSKTNTGCICTLKQPRFQVVERTPWGTCNSGGAIAVFQVQPVCNSPFLLAARQARTVQSWWLESYQVSASGMCSGERQADATNCLQPALH